MNINLPTSADLKEVEQAKLPELTKDDPSFKLFPTVQEPTDTLQWEQRDNYTGVQAARGLNGQPARVRKIGAKRWQAEIGYYGDFEEIDEQELTRSRELGTFGEAASMDYLISWKQDYLLNREIDRMRLMIWTLLATATYSAVSPSGAIIHTDTYPLRKVAAAVPWATFATATPMVDLRGLKVYARGYSTRFDQSATAYCNINTANNLLNNQNPQDLAGKRTEFGATFNSLVDVNRVLAAQDLPQFEVYDKTYYPDATPTTPVPFIPDNIAVIIGPRTNAAPVGDICQTRNANNAEFAAGSYTLITDSLMSNINPVPRIIRLDRGWNGGLRMYYPSSVLILQV